MNKSKKVSIIIPTFNRESLIKRAINSVFLQDYPDIEIIVIDDGSTDNTFQIIKEYNDNRIIYLKNPYNLGASKSRNIGINLAKGKYISFLDSDDEWLPGKLSAELKLLDENPDCAAVSFDQIFINQKNNKIIKRRDFLRNSCNDMKKIKQEDVLRGDCLLTNDFTIRKEILLKIQGFDENLLARQDWDIWIRITSIAPVLQSSLKLTNKYIFHGKQISLDINKKIRGTIDILNKYKNLFFADETACFRIYLRIILLYAFRNEASETKLFLKEAIEVINCRRKRIALKSLLFIVKVFNKTGIRMLAFFYRVIKQNSYLSWSNQG